MRKRLAFIPLAMWITLLQSQNLQITFGGTGDTNVVDSIKVENITLGTHASLGGSDILELSSKATLNRLNVWREGAVSLYPNPVNGLCTLFLRSQDDEETTIDVYDMSGKKMACTMVNLTHGDHQFSVSGIGRGIYIVKIHSKNYSYSKKIIGISDNNGSVKIVHVPVESGSTKTVTNDTKEGEISNKIIQLQYNEGDILIAKGESGKYSTLTVLSPTASTHIMFKFVDCTDFDGNNYSAIAIGTQTWIAQNLKTKSYRNGDSIPTTLNNVSQEVTPKYQWAYDGSDDNVEIYGRLYTWHTVNDVRGLAPKGWHIPSDEEWTTLMTSLDGELIAGGKLKETGTVHWITPNSAASNVSGFTALPGGYRRTDGLYYEITRTAYFWSSTSVNNDMAYMRSILNYGSWVSKSFLGKKIGFSVRCIKD